MCDPSSVQDGSITVHNKNIVVHLGSELDQGGSPGFEEMIRVLVKAGYEIRKTNSGTGG
jgi:hypothetical protein